MAAQLYYVVGRRADGSACVLSTHTRRGKADDAAALYRARLQGYAEIAVEENGESKVRNRQSLTTEGGNHVPAEASAPGARV